MIQITVRPFYYIAHALGGKKKIEIALKDGATIHELLSLLRASYHLPDQIRVDKYTLELFSGNHVGALMILINGKDIRTLHGLGTKLEDEAEVALFPLVAGG